VAQGELVSKARPGRALNACSVSRSCGAPATAAVVGARVHGGRVVQGNTPANGSSATLSCADEQ
jgi:hypothetical protein